MFSDKKLMCCLSRAIPEVDPPGVPTPPKKSPSPQVVEVRGEEVEFSEQKFLLLRKNSILKGTFAVSDGELFFVPGHG